MRDLRPAKTEISLKSFVLTLNVIYKSSGHTKIVRLLKIVETQL